MAELHWFPFYAKDWLSSPARMAMLPEQRGAYMDLLAVAWGNGDVDPSLPADDSLLAGLSGLGQRWKRLGGLIRQQFTERDGLLYNAKLSEVWQEQQDKHAVAVTKGRKGGKTKARNRKPSSSSATAQGVAGAYQSESEGTVQTLTESVPVPAPVGALGVEPPRLPGANSGPPTALADIIPAAVFDRFGADWRAAMAGEPH